MNFEEKLQNLVAIQKECIGDDPYMRGLYNGLLLALCTLTGEEYKPV